MGQGQMPIANLNRATVAALDLHPKQDGTPSEETFWWDDNLTGFALRIRTDTSGKVRRTFIIQYRFGGKVRKIKLGDAGKLNVDQARKKAEKLFAQILLGSDPQVARRAEWLEAQKLTFSQAVAQYIQMKAPELRPSSLKSLQLYLTGTAYFPTLHRKPLDSITRSDVQHHLDRMGGTPTAGQARAHLMSFFMWALRRGHCSENVVIATEEPKGNGGRDRHLSADELRQVWNACTDDDFGKIVRLLILTGCRRAEIGGLRWSEIDLDAATITLPKERCKNGREHTLTLPPMAMDILRSIPQRVGRDHLFGQRGQGFVAWGHSRKAFKVDFEKPWTLHDLRRTVATQMADIGVQPHIIEAVLNHVSGHKAGVAGTYNRSTYSREMRNALVLWGDHVRSLIDGTDKVVVAFRAG
jgi:integrase